MHNPLYRVPYANFREFSMYRERNDRDVDRALVMNSLGENTSGRRTNGR